MSLIWSTTFSTEPRRIIRIYEITSSKKIEEFSIIERVRINWALISSSIISRYFHVARNNWSDWSFREEFATIINQIITRVRINRANYIYLLLEYKSLAHNRESWYFYEITHEGRERLIESLATSSRVKSSINDKYSVHFPIHHRR